MTEPQGQPEGRYVWIERDPNHSGSFDIPEAIEMWRCPECGDTEGGEGACRFSHISSGGFVSKVEGYWVPRA